MSGSDWMEAYTAALSIPEKPKKKSTGPHCCAICCTFFSLAGALMLFIIAGLMNSHYPYLHMEGELPTLSKQVAYAGLVYLAIGLIAVFFWVKGILRENRHILSSAAMQFQALN